MKTIKVKFLVWNGDITPDEMEDYLDDIRLPISDMLDTLNIEYNWKCYEFPFNIPFLQAEKEAVKKLYDENKSYRFLLTGISY